MAKRRRRTYFDKKGGPFLSNGIGFSHPAAKRRGHHWGAISGGVLGPVRKGTTSSRKARKKNWL